MSGVRERRYAPFRWDADQIQRLTELWLDGQSASKIVSALGGALSRSAVIAKAHRLQLPRRVHGQPTPALAPAVAARTIKRPTRDRRKVSPTPPVVADAMEPVSIFLPRPPRASPCEATGPVPFVHVRDGQCRFSIDLFAPPSADMLVCGAATRPGRSWCSACASRVFSHADPRTARHRSMTR